MSRIYTDLAVIDLGSAEPGVVDIVEGVTFEELQAMTAVSLSDARA